MKTIIMHQNPASPLQVLFNEFIAGKVFTTILATKILRMFFLDEAIDYLDQVTLIKRLLNQQTKVGVWLNVISVDTTGTLKGLELAMMVRYINVCHKGTKPIVFNNEVVFVPETLRRYETKEILDYIQASLAFRPHCKVAVPAPAITPTPPVHSFPNPHPTPKVKVVDKAVLQYNTRTKVRQAECA
jgi:hypothetical protein